MGLHAYLRLSVIGVIFCASVLYAPGIAFGVWWLSDHPGDWQTAVAPLTTVLLMVVTIATPIGRDIINLL